MIFYTSAEDAAPNPRRVEIFLAEKGIRIETVRLALTRREHKQPDHIARHPRGQLPALVLDSGEALTESISICRYLDALHPEPPMFGRNALETARIDMWTRRVELILMSPLSQFWMHAHPFTAHLVAQHRDFGESNRERVAEAMHWLDSHMGGRDFLTGDGFTIADIVLLTTLDFAAFCGLAIPGDCPRLTAFHALAKSRPSAVRA